MLIEFGVDVLSSSNFLICNAASFKSGSFLIICFSMNDRFNALEFLIARFLLDGDCLRIVLNLSSTVFNFLLDIAVLFLRGRFNEYWRWIWMEIKRFLELVYCKIYLPPRCSFVNVTTEIIKVLTGINKLMTITCYNSLLCSENYFRKKTTRPAMIEKTR